MSFSSDDINYLIYRYLHESGFEHSAFTFASESRVLESGIAGSDIPMGALINVVQKGIFYTEAELCSVASTSTASDARTDKPMMDNLTLLEAVLNDSSANKEREKASNEDSKSPKTVAVVNNNEKHLQQVRDREMRGIHQERRNGTGTTKDNDTISTAQCSFAASVANASSSSTPGFSGITNLNNSPASSSANSHHSFPPSANQNYGQHKVFTGNHQVKVERERESRDRVVNNGQVGKFKIAAEYRATHTNGNINGTPMELDGVSIGHMKNGNGTYGTSLQLESKPYEISKEKIRRLEGHMSEVFVCSWNPKNDLIATGSGDSTVKIWNTRASELPSTTSQTITKSVKTLQHTFVSNINDQNNIKDVTSIDWNYSGDLLATGCYDGRARVWKQDGDLICVLTAHKGPIFALKWSAKGDKILSAGVDKTTIVWNAEKGTELQRFQLHSSSALDIDWISDDTFASCSTDKQIFVCKLGCDKALRAYSGHTNEINAIKYDTHSELLASCSDDMTLKIWSLHSDKWVYNFDSHEKEIYTIRWSPLGYVVASASVDQTVRLWDARDGKCLQTLVRHTEPVYTVGFSPDGTYVASGSFDRSVCIWDVKTGSIVQSYTGNASDGGIFEVAWNCRGDKVAASTSGGTVIILDVRHLKRPL